ncbi:MAG TPA: GAF domain-containing protein [Thermoanaerobaculia bacterium]|nr:GAF domain-containing protein [Thermoanaerobaculia bacterium]
MSVEPDGCTGPVFRIASQLDAERISAIRKHERAVLVFGPNASAADVATSLDALAHDACRSIVLTSKERLPEFQELIDGDRIFYLSCGELSARDLDALIESALDSKQPSVSLDHFLGPADLRRMALAQSVPELADALRAAVAKAAGAARTRCVLFDSERQALWVPNESEGESAAVGLVSFILRTGTTVCLPRLGDDARFDLDLDDPDGEASDRFLGVPIRAGGAVMAVLVAIRTAHEPPFEPLDLAAMEAVAAHASPYVAAWLGEPESDGPFRQRALREHEQPYSVGPEPLRLEPAWTRRATWFAVATFLALVAAFVALKGWLN